MTTPFSAVVRATQDGGARADRALRCHQGGAVREGASGGGAGDDVFAVLRGEAEVETEDCGSPGRAEGVAGALELGRGDGVAGGDVGLSAEVVRGDGQAVVDVGDAVRNGTGEAVHSTAAERDGRAIIGGPLLAGGLVNEGQQLRAERRRAGRGHVAVGAEGGEGLGGDVGAGVRAVADAVAEDCGGLLNADDGADIEDSLGG